MPLPRETIEKLILNAFPDAVVELADLAGDDDHWHLTVTAPAFAGKSRVEQHKMVYAALQGSMTAALHALKLTTKSP